MTARRNKTATKYVMRILNPRSARTVAVPLEVMSPELIRSVFETLKRWPRAFDKKIVPRSPTIQELGRGRSHPHTDLAAELRWTACACRSVARELNLFCQSRDRFSARLFEGNFAAAEAALDLITATTGVSMWLLEARLLLAQASKGPKGLTDAFAELRSQLTDGVSPLLLFFAYQRVDYASTALMYELAVADFLATIGPNSSLEDFGLYVASRAFPLVPAAPHTMVDTLWQESRFSAVDLYLGLLDALRRTLTSAPDAIESDVRHELRGLASQVDDSSLRVLATLLSPTSTLDPNPHERRLMVAADAYTRGLYHDTVALCEIILTDRADCFDAVELWAKATINAGDAESFNPPMMDQINLRDGMKSTVLLALTPAYSARRESIQSLKKMSYALLSLPLGRQIAALCATLTGETDRSDASVLLATNSSGLTPRSSNAIADDTSACDLIHSLELLYEAGPTTALFTAFRSNTIDAVPPDIASVQALRYKARSLHRRSFVADALEAYTRLDEIAPLWSTFSEDALCGRFECLLRLHRFADCATLVTHATLGDRPLPRRTQLSELAEAYAGNTPEIDRAHVAWPIFFWIWAREEPSAERTHDIFAALDTYLMSQGVDRPSRLPPLSVSDTNLRVLFLRVAVAQEVLELSVSFDSVDELESERVAIFEQLVQLDPGNAEDYSEEIERLVRRRAVRRDLQSIDAGRVHVDLEGIRRTLDPTIRVRIDYFVALATGGTSGLDRPALRPSAEAVGEDTSVQFEHIGSLGPFLFRTVFDAIYRRYVSSNEFGLDSYLSLRIRHGVLVGHIRSVLEEAHLVTKRDAKGVYKSNETWDADLKAYDIPGDVPRELLARFSAMTDTILEEVKSQRIQIRSESHPQGLFDFTYSDAELEAVYQRCIKCTTSDRLLDALFAAMNDRTDHTLVGVRAYITIQLDRSLSQALSTLQADLLRVHPAVRFTDLFAAILDCRTRIHGELTTVAGWFTLRNELEHADFDLYQLVATVEEIVRKMNPSSALKVSTAIDVSLPIRGDRFSHLVDILLLLLDNVAKHGHGEPRCAEVACRIEREDLVIAVNNRVQWTDGNLTEDKLESLQRRLQPGDLPADVRREGGSGFFKLKRILEHNLQLGGAFECRLYKAENVESEKGSSFGVRLRVPLGKVCVCES